MLDHGRQYTEPRQKFDNRGTRRYSGRTVSRQKGDKNMKKLDLLAATLLVVGGLNWGLVGVAKFDLVAGILGGMEFGETNAASRVVYSLVGVAAVYGIGAIVAARRPQPRSA